MILPSRELILPSRRTFIKSAAAVLIASPAIVRAQGPILPGPGLPVASGGGYVGPGDIASGAAHFYGVYAYNAAYATGSTPSVNIQDGSAGNGLTLNILTSGFLDTSAMSAWITAHGTPYVSKIWDQIGTDHIVTSTSLPSLVLSDLGSLPAIDFTAGQYLNYSASLALVQAFTLITVARRVTVASLGMIVGDSSATGLFFDGSGVVAMYAQGGVWDFASGATEGNYHSIQGLFAGASSKGAVDGTVNSTVTTNPGTNNLTAAAFNNTGFHSLSRIMSFGLYATDKSASFAAISANDHSVLGF